MSQVVLKNLPSTFSDIEINFADPLKDINKKSLIEAIEFLEDYLYISNREENKDNISYVLEQNISDLLSKYK